MPPAFTPVPPQPQPQPGSPTIVSAPNAQAPYKIVVGPLTTAQGSVRFPQVGDFPAGYSLLTIDGQARASNAANFTDIGMQANDDMAANYVWQQLFGNNNVPASAQGIAPTATPLVARVPAATAGAGTAGVFDLRLPNYGGPNFHKEAICTSQSVELFAAASEFLIVRGWHYTGFVPIRSLLLFAVGGTFVAGSLFVLQLL